MATVSINLPAPLTRFVGREAELARAAALLTQGRLLTLIGPGGAGKTRLAVQLASVGAAPYPHGGWVVGFPALAEGRFVCGHGATAPVVKGPGRDQALSGWMQPLL